MEQSVVKELKEKYDVIEIINKRYEGDDNIINFYKKYYNEVEKIESIGFKIWKIFGEIWIDEKQNLILEILSLTLLLEKECLKIKKNILVLLNKNKQNKKIKEDKMYLLKLIKQKRDENNIFIDITTKYDELNIKYHQNREKFKEIIENEFKRIKNETFN